MSLTRKLSELLRGRARARRGAEQDVEPDEHQALRRPVGGTEHRDASTTGSGASGEFVGRIAGEDPENDR